MYSRAFLTVAREEGKMRTLSSFEGFDRVPEIRVLLGLLSVTFQALSKQVLFVKPLGDCCFVFVLFIFFKHAGQAAAGTVQYS